MVRHTSFPLNILTIICLLWIFSVATEWSFQSRIEQMLSAEQAKFQLDEKSNIPVIHVHPSVEKNSQQIQAVGQQNKIHNREDHYFICDTAPDRAKRHQPIVMISNSRTGSNLLFSFFGRLAYLHENQVDALLLYEVFADEKDLQAQKLCHIIDQIRRGCGWDSNNLYIDRKFASPEEVLVAALAEFNATPSQQNVLLELREFFDQRYTNPARLMDFIHRVPSLLPHPFFVLKVFPYHIFEQMNSTVAEFASIFSGMDPEYVILWRRNMLEIFVSLQIALSKKSGWTLEGTTKDDAVVIKRDALDWYVQNVAEFFIQARDYLQSNSIPYEEFEYNRDLIDETGHSDIVRRIQTYLLHQAPDEEIVQAVFEPPSLAKQATVPVSDQIVNWDDVKSWGYSALSDDWPDLFSQKTSNKNGGG